MKSITNFKITKLLYINVIIIAFLSPTFEDVGGGLKAQTVDIFLNSLWLLQDSEINGLSVSISDLGGASFESPPNEDSFLLIYGNSCFENIMVPYSNLTNNSFSLDIIEEYIQCNYTDPDEIAAVELYLSFYFELPLETNGTPKNPFTYSWADGGFPVEDLIITNPDGDWLLYRREFLSTPTFHQGSFTLYPNPVNESLNVKNNLNQQVTVAIYDIDGKWVQNHALETNLSRIDVKKLTSGLYFVVFENESGERVSKKFVKH